MRGVLELYDSLPQKLGKYSARIGSPREMYFWMLTLDLGKRTMRANLEWAEHIIAQIKRGEIPRD
jgi:hypothetical protein